MSDSGRYTLKDNGQIFWQKDSTNPLPGEHVADIKKGIEALKPTHSKPEDERLTAWLQNHINTSLECLVNVNDLGEVKPEIKKICDAVNKSMGLIERISVQNEIAVLDSDDRRVLRQKGLRLGPVLIYMPQINKPAAVRLRALLWALWQGWDLPAPTPYDGIVSFAYVEKQKGDKDFYAALGYPVFGPRVIRVDMLDRVIVDIYDSATEGKFRAKTSYAEWLGCGVEDMYAVIESMGHRKIPQDIPEGEEENKELAEFYIRKGKAADVLKTSKPKPVKKPKIKPVKKESGPRVYSSEAKSDDADNPFAVLKQLKE